MVNSIEKERPIKPHIAAEVKPIIDELLKNDIIKKADYQGNFLCNAHAVAKPVGSYHIAGKASTHILRQQGYTLDLILSNLVCLGRLTAIVFLTLTR